MAFAFLWLRLCMLTHLIASAFNSIMNMILVFITDYFLRRLNFQNYLYHEYFHLHYPHIIDDYFIDINYLALFAVFTDFQTRFRCCRFDCFNHLAGLCFRTAN